MKRKKPYLLAGLVLLLFLLCTACGNTAAFLTESLRLTRTLWSGVMRAFTT